MDQKRVRVKEMCESEGQCDLCMFRRQKKMVKRETEHPERCRFKGLFCSGLEKL